MTFYQLPRAPFRTTSPRRPTAASGSPASSKGFIGRFDPKTGKLEKIPLGPGAAPHGVVVGPDGAAWVTEGGQNAIARVDAATKAVKLFPLPKEFALRQPQHADDRQQRRRLVHRPERRLWPRRSRRPARSMHGRRRRAAGPTASPPRPSGDVWYASLAGDHIAKVDTTTGAVTVVEPPKPGVGPRRVWSDSKGVLWVSFWQRRRDRALRPGEQDLDRPIRCRRASPARYSIYVDDKDRVWATDWIANAIQRFDPKTETYETFPSDKQNANVRQMLGRPGEAWGGESGTDRLVVVRD